MLSSSFPAAWKSRNDSKVADVEVVMNSDRGTMTNDWTEKGRIVSMVEYKVVIKPRMAAVQCPTEPTDRTTRRRSASQRPGRKSRPRVTPVLDGGQNRGAPATAKNCRYAAPRLSCAGSGRSTVSDNLLACALLMTNQKVLYAWCGG